MNETMDHNAGLDEVAARGGGLYLLRMLVVGAIVALALGLTLLTWALPLMAMLGVFFFMLFGLLIGASMFRAGAGGRPLPKRGLLIVTILVTLIGWSSAILKEAYDFPEDFVAGALDPKNPPDQQLHVMRGDYERVEAQLQSFIVSHMAERYAPGGMLGYFKMAATGGTVEIDLPDQPRKIVCPTRAPAWLWWLRIVLALGLMFTTMNSVTAGLAKMDKPRERASSPPVPLA